MKGEANHDGPHDHDEAARREAVWAEWEGRAPKASGWRRWLRRESWRDHVQPGEAGDEDGYVAPPKRSAFPPSFLVLLSIGAAILALEPTADLSYTLLGSAAVLKLGEPGEYHLDAARDGALASVNAFAYPDRGTYSHDGTQYEVFALTSLPILVRRSPQPRPPPNVAELYRGKGRLIRLDAGDSSFLERLVRPAARYSTVREQFQAIGELPVGKTCWMLLDGDVPRAHLLPIVLPFVLWAASLFFAFGAWRSHRLRELRRRALQG